jgi:polysaccharide export outer membrane protein
MVLISQNFAVPVIAATTPQPPSSIQTPSNVSVPGGLGDEYVLGPTDRLQIDFFNVAEFSGQYRVLPNGTLYLPRVGAVSVQGMSLKQASAMITERYRGYLSRPLVTLSLVEARPIHVAVAGEINSPGAYGMRSGVQGRESDTLIPELPTLTRLIFLAEGVTQAADLSAVRITRREPGGTQKVYQVDLWQLLRSGDTAQDIRLNDGDSIYIPATENINLANALDITRSTIATNSNRPLRIAIVGEVNRPGPYTLLEGTQQAADRNATPNLSATPTITKAIQIAGGITQMADLRNVQVRRMTSTGKDQVVQVNFWELLKSGNVLQDLPLQDGDRIEIGRASTIDNAEITEIAKASFSADKITVNVVGEVERPGAVSIRPNEPLNQGILAAGGFNKTRAKEQDVTLVRLEPNGTISKRDIKVSLAQGVNETTNPALRDGDTIVVKRNALASLTDTIGAVLSPVIAPLGVLQFFGLGY